jgi:hypothetical protein
MSIPSVAEKLIANIVIQREGSPRSCLILGRFFFNLIDGS